MPPDASCAVCANFHPEVLDQMPLGQHATQFIDAGELARSVQSKSCPECQLLSDAIIIRHKGWASNAAEWHSMHLLLASGKPAELTYWAPHASQYRIRIQIYRPLANNDLSMGINLPKTIGEAVEIPRSSGSPESISLIRKWYAECEAEHELCNPYLTGEMPSRLLDIQREDPVLVETSQLEHARYVALSYCWGIASKHPVVQTTEATFAKHQAGVRFDSLPVLIRDVIFLAKALAFKYLWIDALCIIQNDADDWNKEAATICQVYSQASLTIITSRSDGTATSIFGTQKFFDFDAVIYKSVPLIFREDISRAHVINPVTPAGEDKDPICYRGWTFQEAMVSKRAVYFGREELRWECNTWQNCQCGQLAKKLPLKCDLENFEYEWYRLWRVVNFCPVPSVKDAFQVWATMVGFYTRRLLTKDRDRLIALAGLAQRFAEVLEDNFAMRDSYLAGIWKSTIPFHLLWSVLPKGEWEQGGYQSSRPSCWRAPSWSWASMEAPIKYSFTGQLESRLDVMDAVIEPLGKDHFSQLKSALLRVRAPVLHGVRVILDATQTSCFRFPIIKWQTLELHSQVSYFDDDLGATTDQYLGDPKQKFSLLVVCYNNGNDMHECLAIVPVPGKTATYERIGKVELGQHFREPKENGAAIKSVMPEVVTLI